MISDFTNSPGLQSDQFDLTAVADTPSQFLDFVQNIAMPGGLPDNVLSVARASEAFLESADGQTATKILANKLMLTDAGLHVWEQRTNAVLNSVDFTTWSSRGTPVFQNQNQLAPDGTLTASTISVKASNNTDMFRVFTGLTPSTNQEVSFWIERVSTTGFLRVQRTSSTFGETGQWEIDMSFLPDNWVRITENHPSVTATQNFRSSTLGKTGIFFFTVDGIERTFNLWGVQSEEGGAVSPYVSTQGAAITRLKDEITQPVSQMRFGTNAGMIVIDLVTPDLAEAPGPTLFSLNDDTINNGLLFFRGALGYRLKHNIPGQSVELVVTGISDLTRHKIAVGWKADGKLNVSVDGTTVQTFDTAASVNFNPQTMFNLGSDVAEGSQLNSTINSLTTYPNYSDALLQSRSA